MIAMSNRTFMAAVIILAFLISIVAGMQSVEVAKANPFFIYKTIDPIPGATPPTITILSPENNTVYSSDKITVSFNVSRPLLGTCNTAIIDVKYTLDNETVQAFSIWRGGSASDSKAIPDFNTTFTLPSLPTGNHNLTVTAEGVVYAGNMSIFFIDGASTTFFATGTQPLQPSPTPTQTPTLAPTVTPSPSPTPLTIDLANGNYMSRVAVGQTVYFSAVVSNGVPPYRYQWYYRPYYVGAAIGDVYPIGDKMQGATSQNFTFIGNSTGHYLISIEAWDSEGAEGYFMSLPNPGIWV